MHVQLQQKWGECAEGLSGLESIHGSPLLPNCAHGPAIGRLTFYFLAETICMLFHGKFLDLNLSQVILVKPPLIQTEVTRYSTQPSSLSQDKDFCHLLLDLKDQGLGWSSFSTMVSELC